jgi:predicted porin
MTSFLSDWRDTVKKVLLVGVAGGVLTGAAWAQSSVTMYGIADMAVQASSFSRAGAGSLTSVNSGHKAGSRWGLRGTEDLGGGLSAIFRLEQGVNMDTGTLGQGGRAFGRHAHVGLEGRFGTVAFGRISTFDGGAFDMFTQIDPFLAGYGVGNLASSFSAWGGLRVDNAVIYRSPRLAGFQAGAMHSFQANGQELAGSGTNTRFDHVGANFQFGPFYAAIDYSKAKFPVAKDFKDQEMLYAGATYDFKVAKLHAAYGVEKGVRSELISSIGATAEGTDAKSWMLGASVPFGPLGSRFFGSIQKRNGEAQTIGATTFDADRKVFGFGYDYFLSRRTILHVSAAKSKGSNTLAPTRAATDFANKREFTLGMTHFF